MSDFEAQQVSNDDLLVANGEAGIREVTDVKRPAERLAKVYCTY